MQLMQNSPWNILTNGDNKVIKHNFFLVFRLSFLSCLTCIPFCLFYYSLFCLFFWTNLSMLAFDLVPLFFLDLPNFLFFGYCLPDTVNSKKIGTEFTESNFQRNSMKQKKKSSIPNTDIWLCLFSKVSWFGKIRGKK